MKYHAAIKQNKEQNNTTLFFLTIVLEYSHTKERDMVFAGQMLE
jgi:hypothetical protein